MNQLMYLMKQLIILNQQSKLDQEELVEQHTKFLSKLNLRDLKPLHLDG